MAFVCRKCSLTCEGHVLGDNVEIGSAADFKAIAQICRPSLPDAIALPCHQDPETEKWLNNEHTFQLL